MIALSSGARFGAYRLIRPLGKGGFAEVWEAEHEANGRRVALKVLTELRADERGLARFRQEGRLAAALSNPHCVYVFDAGAHEDLPYIAMELVSGGTLADRIAAGPLEPRVAVDVVLDVLEGLESAQQAGILHRDVKPSNVFLDADGRAKIGDFGISKSLEVDSHLSQTGAFLGTPYYASPEQIAAEPLDLRSDLYSVGAMLYELVTGKVPYAGTNASSVLAQVLTRDPVPFAQHAVTVPAALQHVILRLLAKPKEKRFQSYAQLRAALVPLSTRGLAPAGRGRRFGAIVIDIVLFVPLGIVVGSVTVKEAMRGNLTLAGAMMPTLLFLYFTLTEGLGGASVGKRLLGLRVTTPDGALPPLWRVALRTLVFCGLYDGTALALQLVVGDAIVSGTPLMQVLPGLLKLGGIAALVSTMRGRNGYAGLHEVVSGTRTAALVARERSGAVPRLAPPLVAATADAAFGPYRASGKVWRDAASGEALLVARDEDLHRDVWIHECRDARAAPPVAQLRARGEGSLPWLQRGTRDGVTWDAYGAPQGTSLVRWAAGRPGGLGWRELRDVLASLARELESRFAREGSAGPLSPRHVWVDPSGRALLLDFPAEPPDDGAADVTADITPERWRDFLRGIVRTGFQRDTAPLPQYAAGIVASLAQGDGAIADFRAALERVAARPAEVTRTRRAGMFAVLGLVPAFAVLLRLAVPLLMGSMPGWYRDIALNSGAYLAAVQRADSAGAAADSATRRTAAAAQVVLAAAALDARRVPQGGQSLVAAMPAELRAALDSALRRYPAPDSAQVAAARAWLAAGHVAVPELRGGLAVVPKALLQSLVLLGALGAGGVVLALLMRGGVLFGLFGIGVVRTDGAPAGRLRCAARAVVAWAPLLLLLVFASLPRGLSFRVGARAPVTVTSEAPAPRGDRGGDLPPWLRWTLAAVALAGAGVAVWRPTRGVAERVSGVVLVPK